MMTMVMIIITIMIMITLILLNNNMATNFLGLSMFALHFYSFITTQKKQPCSA